MIHPKDYMQPIGSMTDNEKSTYFEDVRQWNEEQYPRLEAVVDAWTEAEYKVFDEGLLLCSALSRARQFVGLAYKLSIDRRLKEIRGFMNAILKLSNGKQLFIQNIKNKQKNVIVAKVPKIEEDNAAKDADEGEENLPDQRPNHYDEWENKMSSSLRNKVAGLSSLYAAMAHYRQMVENLAADPRHSEQDLSRAARLVVEYEKKVLSIHRQADIEWAELTGRKVSEDVKREALSDENNAEAAVKKLEDSFPDEENNKSGENDNSQESDEERFSKMTYQELKDEPGMPDGLRKYFMTRRLQYLKKRLYDTKTKKTKEYIDKVRDSLKEWIEAGANVTTKIRANMLEMGINVDEFNVEKDGNKHS